MLSDLIKKITKWFSTLSHKARFILSILLSIFIIIYSSTSMLGNSGILDDEDDPTNNNQVSDSQLTSNDSLGRTGTEHVMSKPTSTNTSVPTSTPEPTPTITPTREPTNTPEPTQTPIPPTPIPPTSTPVVVGSVEITFIYYDGQEKRYEGDEYAEITNTGSVSVNLGGWRLNAGAPEQDFNFPNYTLNPGQSCRVYTDEIHDEYCGFSFYSSNSALWNNGGDCGYLFDASGKQVNSRCY